MTETCMGVVFRSLLRHFGIKAKSVFLSLSLESNQVLSYFGSISGRAVHNLMVPWPLPESQRALRSILEGS